MKVLITGSSGYVGNFLAVSLGKNGISVIGVDVNPHAIVTTIPNFTFLGADVRNKVQIKKIFDTTRPTHVIHLAYLMDPSHDKHSEYDVDVQGSKNVFEVANETASVEQFILFSSTSIYGASPKNSACFTETDPLEPGEYTYAVYKKEIETSYHQFVKRPEMKLVIFRMCTAVGPSYYKKGGVVSSLANGPFHIQVGPVTNAVQFIHEDDVKAVVETVLKDSEVEETFNLCSDSSASVFELAACLNKSVVRIPLWFFSLLFWFLWHCRIALLTPAMAKLIAYPLIASPKKLMDRYQYHFQYDTKSAFLDAVEKRRASGML